MTPVRKEILLLGASGSIGRSALDIVSQFPDRFRVVAMVSRNNVERMRQAILQFHPRIVAMADPAAAAALREAVKGSLTEILEGEGGILECVARCGASLCLSAIVGSAGLLPTLAALEAGMDLALANKETLVAAGHLVTAKARAKGVRILPVDSEHSALFQCLGNTPTKEVRSLIITASGGPFRGYDAERLRHVTRADALMHPTWSMGEKITIDSATLANKALEAIEAHWLFGIDLSKIRILVHPQSLVHGMVEFVDGSLLAHLAKPDMRLPILFALAYPERVPLSLEGLSVSDLTEMTFEHPDRDRFPMLDLGFEAGRRGGVAPAVYSAANEEAVASFLAERIRFVDIPDLVASALDRAPAIDHPDLEMILAAEREARASVRRRVGDRQAISFSIR